MSRNESIVQSLLSGIEFGDSRLYDLLLKISNDLYRLDDQINPPTVSGAFGLTGQIIVPDTVTGFIDIIYSNNVRLSWDGLDGLVSYEIRYKIGSNTETAWDTATSILRTSTLSADINPLTIPLTFGNHTFLIKSIDSNGKYSDVASYVIVAVPVISAPVVTSIIVGNFVLLYWTVPSSTFTIDHYNIYKDSVLQGKMNGTFEAIFESVGGNFTYVVEPVDIVGNVGTASGGLTVAVSNPSDFVLHASITSILNGTYTNAKKETVSGVDYILATIVTETYENHFINNSWATPQAQITAGYPIYIEPSNATGQYQETFDFGSIINNVIVVVNWSMTVISGLVGTNTTTLEVSNDNITWSAPTTGYSMFAASVRYVRLKLKFVPSTDKGLAYFNNLQCLLNVHREQDGGQANVLAADAAGTVITLNKAFVSIDSITVTPVGTVLQTAIYDFAFPTYPTTFKVKLYDNAGARVNGTITWIARGII